MNAVINPNQALWEKGDFTEIAAFMRTSGEALVESLGVTARIDALDLGCGDGTTALPLAERCASVTGIDIARNLVDAGKRRAAMAGLTNITFRQGDACDLRDVPDNTFDLTLTMFGAMFAPKPFEVAAEMVRVTKPGGRIVMGNWIPKDPASFVSRMLAINSDYMPAPPEGFVSPMTWGMPAQVMERFDRAGVAANRIEFSHDTFVFASEDRSPAEFLDAFRRWYGPTMNAYAAARDNGREDDLHARLQQLVREQNQSTTGGVYVPATFLRVTVRL